MTADPQPDGRVIDDPFTASKRYTVVYADPPWHYRDRAEAGERGAGYKYPVMSDRQVAELPVANILADDALLFLWVTWPKLPEILPVIDHWGFTYRTVGFVWVKRGEAGKLAWGMGSWSRANTEPCLLGIRGRPKRISGGVHQVVEAPLARHSAKPGEVRDRIVQLVGDVPRIELFARHPSPGWDAWGNEVREGPGAALGEPSAPRRRRSGPVPERVQRRVLDQVGARGHITRKQAAELLELAPGDASTLLKQMLRAGLLARNGTGSGSWYGPPQPGQGTPPARRIAVDRPVPEDAQRRVLEHVAARGRITRSQAAELLELAPEQATALLVRLVRARRLARNGAGRGTWYGPAGDTA